MFGLRMTAGDLSFRSHGGGRNAHRPRGIETRQRQCTQAKQNRRKLRHLRLFVSPHSQYAYGPALDSAKLRMRGALISAICCMLHRNKIRVTLRRAHPSMLQM
jgi:hypothetical protein